MFGMKRLFFCVAAGIFLPLLPAADPFEEKTPASELRKSAEKGDSEAQLELGHCYRKGEGVEPDRKEAVRCFRQSAEQGHADAQMWLGNCYYGGMGVKRNVGEAEKWYKKSAAQGYVPAKKLLQRYRAHGRL